ncbi:phospholipase A [Colwelliaceae bacterium 6471]
MRYLLILTSILLTISTVVLADNSRQDACLLKMIKQSSPQTTVADLKEKCQRISLPQHITTGVISKRVLAERAVEFNPYVITPHKMNYILPAAITDNFNTEPYEGVTEFSQQFENLEAKYQISFKVPLNADNLLIKNDKLYFGMTIQSWWQIYANNISKPFRETNYQPEIAYLAPTNWHPFGGNLGFGFGIEHQSNGRTQILSRSWNRLYGQLFFEKGSFAASLRPWYRLAEDKKETPLSSKGDDNPDILDYMGHFELGMGYKWENFELTALTRQNFSTHKGALELGFIFPMWGKLNGYVQYFTGYGESLIDYNHSQQKIGIGIALTNTF